MNDLISIKGGRDGLRLLLDDIAEWSAIMRHLQEQLAQNPGFFAGAKLTVDIGDRALNPQQMDEILLLMQQHGVQADSLNATARESRNAARAAGITARPLPRYTDPPPTTIPGSDQDALWVTRTLRSGQVLRHHGHITLIGDVNPGAELIAGGSVIVWGRLKGLVHAGALGNTEAIICAIELRPTQLRIANQITRAPDGAGRLGPEMARIDNSQIIVEPWESAKR